jgi:GntR family transcriptional regulator, transcriptional repressor for pyruvate dehydrogenase complex
MSPSRWRKTVAEEVAEELRSMILTGQVKPGDLLESQKVLAERFNVGLSSVREAIQILSALGLVESHPGKGTWVRENALNTLFSPNEIKARLGALNTRQVYEARMVVEAALTRLAAERATPEDIRAIWTALAEMKAAQDNPTFIQADLEFHLAVARAGHNPLLEQFYYLSRQLLSEVISQVIMLPHVKEESIPLQENIARAIATHDIEQAIAAEQAHMRYIDHMLATYT